jgi:ferredoxin
VPIPATILGGGPGRNGVVRGEPLAGVAGHPVLLGSLHWSFSAHGDPCLLGGAREEVRMKVTIDLDRCIGCGTCEELCPDVFVVGDDGFAHVLVADSAAWADDVVAAAESCPQDAIVVDDG